MTVGTGGRRILMTLDAVGGVWIYTLALARALKAEGMTVGLLGFGPEPSVPARAQAEELGPVYWSGEPLDWQVTGPEALAAVPGVIRSACREFRPDVLQVSSATQAARLELGVPVVVVAHSCLATWFRSVRNSALPDHLAWHGALSLAGLRAARAVIAPTAAHAALVAHCYPGAPAPAVVPNAVRPASPEQNDNRAEYAIAVGRWWDPGKGAAVLDAAAEWMRVPVRMIGPLSAPGQMPVSLSHAQPMGAMSHAATLGAMRAASFVVAPSLYEPFGLAVAEAAARGLPLLLSDLPGFQELWAGAALFYARNNPRALAAAAGRLADGPALRAELGAAAARRAAGLGQRRQTLAMMGIYHDVLACPEPNLERA